MTSTRALFDQYWIDMYPVWSANKMACTELNVPQNSARDACLAEEPVETPKLCSLTDQEKLMGTL